MPLYRLSLSAFTGYFIKSKCKLTCYKYAWNTEYVICLKFSLRSEQGYRGTRRATNLIIFSKWFLSFFMSNFSLLLFLLLLLLLLQHLRPTQRRKTCHGLSAFYAKHKTKASTTRRWRLVKFSLVWFFFLPLPLGAITFVFAFSFYVFVFTTIWRQFCYFPHSPSSSCPALPIA